MYGKQSKEELEKWIEQIELSSKIEEQEKEEINKNRIQRHKHRRGQGLIQQIRLFDTKKSNFYQHMISLKVAFYKLLELICVFGL